MHWLNYEQRKAKANNMTVRHDKTQISLCASLVGSEGFTIRVRKARISSYMYPLSAQRRLGSDWTEVKADLSIRSVHTYLVGFVMQCLLYQPCFLQYMTVQQVYL